MTREELIKFLDACFDAEEGRYECERLINAISTKERALDRMAYDEPLPDLPEKPKKPTPLLDRRENLRNLLADEKSERAKALLNFEFARARRAKQEIEKYKQRLAQAEAEFPLLGQKNQELMKNYEKMETSWEQKNESYKTAIRLRLDRAARELRSEKTELEKKRDHFQEALSKLYNQGVLHTDFQNTQAICRLKSYLDMKAADQLEGPTGAYRLYLEDLRAQKITDSIDDLRASVEKGFSQVFAGQKAIYDQLVRANNNLVELDQHMDRRVTELKDQIIRTGADLSSTIQESSAYEQALLHKMQSDQQLIGSMVAKSAYNTYLVDRMNNLDNYLVYTLQNPLT